MNNQGFEHKGKAISQIVYSPQSFSQTGFYPKPTQPPSSIDLNDRELLKEQFYLNRFIRILEANTTMPTLPDQALLQAIKKENSLLQEKVEAFRSSTYENYLEKKLALLNKEAQFMNSPTYKVDQLIVGEKKR